MLKTAASAHAILPILVLAHAGAAAAEYRNGSRFDPGREMTARAEGAPAELDRVAGLVGQWDVQVEIAKGDEEAVKAEGLAEISFMNRGHALMENFYSKDFDGHDLAALRFLGYNPASKRWFLAGADSWSERAWVADGDFDANALVLADVRRLGGGVTLTGLRWRIEQPSADAIRVIVESSADGGATFSTVETRTYARREPSDDFLRPASAYGSPAPDRFEEAGAFDFLIGEWVASHQMTFPNGQQAKWTSNDSGVYALNGSAVMEFSWFDQDPNLPDAATTILRLYNRGMRRWENLYLTNRGHSVLYFGGVQEGDEIVLHPFEAGASGTLSRWVFHDIDKDSYRWYGTSSTDRGETWTKTWLIDVERKPDKPSEG